METPIVKKRERYLDLAKGLGILCIVFLHYENGVLPGHVNVFIGSFMISIFYLVAGWVLAMKDRGMSTRELARRRLRSLGLPYLYWTLIIIGFDMVLWSVGYYDSYFIFREVYKSIVLRGVGTLWFLPALFFGELIWNWLRVRSRWLWLVALAVVVLYRLEYGMYFQGREGSMWNIIKAPFYTIDSAASALMYVAAGSLFYRLLSGFKSRLWLTLTGLALCTLGYLSASWLGVVFGQAGGMLWMFFAPVLGPLGFILLFKGVQSWKLWNYFDYWGRNSLSLMVTHYSIVQVLIVIFIEKVLHLPFDGWITIYAFVASMPVQYLITQALNRWYPRLLKA